MRRAVSSSSSEGASSSRTKWCRAARPCLRALREERALPSAVTGPRERAPLRRAASIWAGQRGRAAVAGMIGVRRIVRLLWRIIAYLGLAAYINNRLTNYARLGPEPRDLVAALASGLALTPVHPAHCHAVLDQDIPYWVIEQLFQRRRAAAPPPDLHRIGLRELRLLDATTRLGNLRGLPGNRLEASKGDHAGRHGAAPRVLFRAGAAQIRHDLDRAEHAIGERLMREVTRMRHKMLAHFNISNS